ncbi:peptidoglycan-binding domain-containing protein [Methanosarcina sp.]|uniref:peptidoglycan-binding domain-containing protein n=1 Tax=Methanosarcina sp. TaxID=2213 RepID=UPI003C7586B7
MKGQTKKTIAILLVVCFLVSITTMSASACSCKLTSHTLKNQPILKKVCQGDALLKKGSQGQAVALLQRALIVSGYSLPKYKADGYFGSETEKAVKKFQADHGLVKDGIVGSCTLAALDKDTAHYELTYWKAPSRA